MKVQVILKDAPVAYVLGGNELSKLHSLTFRQSGYNPNNAYIEGTDGVLVFATCFGEIPMDALDEMCMSWLITRNFFGSDDMLKELARAKLQYGMLVELCKEVLEFHEQAPFDFTNGVTHMGIDEGDVRGWKALNELDNKIKEVLEDANNV